MVGQFYVDNDLNRLSSGQVTFEANEEPKVLPRSIVNGVLPETTNRICQRVQWHCIVSITPHRSMIAMGGELTVGS